jgi:D-beta-D-heptose 7-phosphate kinase/D-beta-D-heptose 1-phosphate adenosyltransferase
VTRDEILRDLLVSDSANRTDSSACKGKIRAAQELLNDIVARRQIGQKVAFTNGCFDILHAGHVQLLLEARAQADALVVGLNSDTSVRELKGPTRPINSLEARACVLAALEMVDYITVFDETTPLRLIDMLRPDVLVKGADYSRAEVVGGDVVESYGGRVHLAALRLGYSTSNLIQRLAAA